MMKLVHVIGFNSSKRGTQTTLTALETVQHWAQSGYLFSLSSQTMVSFVRQG